MKPTIYITLLLLCGFLNSHAQTSDWEEAYNKLPQKDRDEFYEYARDFLENNYYIQLSLAIEEGMEFRRHFIENIFGDENNAGAARFQPEFLPESDRQRFLTPAQYLQELSAAYKGKSDVEFHVSNVREDEHMHGYTSPTNSFAQLDYDLEIEHEGRTLLKRRCRMCCLFPNTSYKLEVRLMQIEPLEDIYLMAEGTEGDASISEETAYPKELEKYFKEAKQGDAYAQCYLGYCFYDGAEGVEKDYNKAVVWFTIAALQDHANAQVWLGSCYLYGLGVEKDETKAVEWFTKAALQNDDNAQVWLGSCYEYGLGVEIDEAKAAEWYAKAAEKGNANAQYRLGDCYYYGQGVPKDYDKAIEWYTQAANQGFEDAKKVLAHLNPQSTSTVCQGFVKDKEGTPIVGTSILIKGTSTGTIADLNGYFQLETAKKGDRIQFDFIGYKTRTIEWDGTSILNITLIED